MMYGYTNVFVGIICLVFIPIGLVASTSEEFIANSGCRSQVLQEFETYQTFETLNVLDCARHCSKDDNCFSINFVLESFECQLNRGIIAGDCINGQHSQQAIYFERMEKSQDCQHGGSPVSDATCDCVDGYTGNQCERLISDCVNGYDIPYYTGKHLAVYIQPKAAPKPFLINCRFEWGGRNIILQHLNPSFVFNRTWQEYKEGFGLVLGEQWLGLDKIYYLTQSGVNKVGMQYKFANTTASLANGLTDFLIGGESDNYRIETVQVAYTNVPTCLPELIGAQFSTYDKNNNQNSSIECAVSYGSGWWFKDDCAPCNPTGKLNGNTNVATTTDYVFLNGYAGTVTGVKMWLN